MPEHFFCRVCNTSRPNSVYNQVLLDYKDDPNRVNPVIKHKLSVCTRCLARKPKFVIPFDNHLHLYFEGNPAPQKLWEKPLILA